MPIEKMTHTWFWKKYLADRKGQPCRLLATGKMNQVLIEFEDGFRAVTIRYGLRRINYVQNRDID